eukprot:CAMPEP_0170563592 /NCGR_PEP_ID=MMETSP0211-20121228/67604_1 /TAXON_ID=311385 /ORGANISM="Pseudokeronopsis sp., Strain OXSARD2" /LENGTH=82 /DNA_ID=CAMNT_0010882003 /DNA_START=385 /DNA_END=633 /DNA_ORIENTATION=-
MLGIALIEFFVRNEQALSGKSQKVMDIDNYGEEDDNFYDDYGDEEGDYGDYGDEMLEVVGNKLGGDFGLGMGEGDFNEDDPI